MTFGQRLQQARKESGMSQEELAELLGVSRQAVSKWENDSGYPEMEKMIRLSQLYHISLDYLVGNEPEDIVDNTTVNGFYVSRELAGSFLTYQKTKFVKIGVCILLTFLSGALSYSDVYYRGVGNVISIFLLILIIVLILHLAISGNPYKKIWRESLTFDPEVLKELRIAFAESKKMYLTMLMSGAFVFLTGFLLLPELYWAVPDDLQHLLYALGDIISGIGGYFAVYAWGIWRAYKILTMNEDFHRKKKG